MPRHPPYTLSILTTFALDTHGLFWPIQLSKNIKMPEHFIPTSFTGGAERARTADPLLAKQVLSQLSYSPTVKVVNLVEIGGTNETIFLSQMVGLDRIELSTSRLSGVRSNHLSYRPSLYFKRKCTEMAALYFNLQI